MRETAQQFRTEGTIIGCVPFGSGHINQTWLVVTNQPHLYILQRVNTETFRDPEGLMNNILMVTKHLRKQDPDPRHVMTLVKLRDGRDYILNGRKELWRMYEYVTGGVCLDRAETTADFRNSGTAFGLFQNRMADFPAEKLTETIPGFHDTPRRYQALHDAIREDRAGRVQKVEPEICFLLEREAGAGLLTQMQKRKELPLRVTHNDTKLNNVMLDRETRQPLCILDLDTVMPGLVASDFGDAIRFGASTALEDEKDLEKVHLDLGLFEAFTRGFLSACGMALTRMELDTLAVGARLSTLENGTRFLTDYLEGDTYFHTTHPEHNLERARTQMRLVMENEKNEARIRDMIRQIETEAGL
jgi:Ser/Thr protein kinase RdoA (MazF antagonist)